MVSSRIRIQNLSARKAGGAFGGVAPSAGVYQRLFRYSPPRPCNVSAQARSAGAALVLALNTDASVRRQGKGDDRPINPLENRAAVAAALASVDLVTWFDDDTPAALIEMVKPDVLIKGGDWPVDKIVGAAETFARGGKVFSIPFLHQTSTTKTLAKIREAGGGA